MFKRSLGLRLAALLTFVCFIPVVLLTMIGNNFLRSMALQDSAKLFQGELDRVTERYEDYFAQMLSACHKITLDEKLIGYLNPRRQYDGVWDNIEVYESYLKPLVNHQSMQMESYKIYFVSETLQQGYGTFVRATQDIQKEAVFARALAAGEEPVWWYNAEDALVYLSRQIVDNRSALCGVFTLTIPRNILVGMISALEDDLMSIALLDENDVVIATNADDDSFVSLFCQMDENTDSIVTDEKNQLLMFENELQGHALLPKWCLVASVPINSIYSTRSGFTIGMALAAGGLFLLFAPLLGLILYKEFKCIYPLIRAMKDVQEGIPGKVQASKREDEIGLLINSYNYMVDELKKKIQENYESKLLLQEAELNALQSQLDPHFIFNVLENIRMRLMINKDTENSRSILMLSRLLRQSISWKMQLVSLEDELSFVEDYLQIQRIRFEKNELCFECVCEDKHKSILIPKFSLQALVENSIKHGKRLLTHGGLIRVYVSEAEGDILIVVEDTCQENHAQVCREVFASLSSKPEGNLHIGLRNVHRRIQLLCGESYGIQKIVPYDEVTGYGWRVEIRIAHLQGDELTHVQDHRSGG